MKAKDIVATIVQCSEYLRLVQLWSSENGNGNGQHLPSENILKVFRAIRKIVDDEKKSFLFARLGQRRPRPYIIDFKVPNDVQTAKDEFDIELNKQMPVFVNLMNSMPIQLMNVMPIQRQQV